MTIDGRAELHRFAQTMVGAFLLSVDQKSLESREALTEAAKGFLASQRCDALVRQFFQTLVRIMAHEMVQERRGDPFRRLVCHPFTELLENGDLSRSLLENYFHFLHLVLGDSLADMTAQCKAILDEVKPDPHFTWDMFYEDERTKLLFWGVLVRIAETFKRFEPRRDWFIGQMQDRHHAVSLASNAFMPLPREEGDDRVAFGVAEFNIMMGALFRPLLDLEPAEIQRFAAKFGATPVRLILPLVEKLV